ncbi:MAG: phosphate uptake regulator PhoU [Candidatus Bathyarchaeia archaeon]
METRKIQQVGHATLTVSLPRDWIKDVGIKRGDLIVFTPQEDGSLNIMPSSLVERGKKSKRAVINSELCSEPRIIEKLIIGNYILGCDTIQIVSSKRISALHMGELRETIKKLIGLGIIEEKSSQVVIQCSIDPEKFSIPSTIRRLYSIASAMHGEAVQSLINSDREMAEEVINRENEANAIYWLILRILYLAQENKEMAKKVGIKKQTEILEYRLIASLLERIADWSENMAKNIIPIASSKVKAPKRLIEKISQLSDLAYALCYKAVECIYTHDISLANSVITAFESTIELKDDDLIKELPIQAPTYIAYLTRILWGIRRVSELAAEIAEVSIDKILGGPNKFCESCYD